MARERLRKKLRKSFHGWNKIFLLGREGEGGKRIGIGGRDNSLSKRRRNANSLVVEGNARSRSWARAGSVEALI